ncbi:HAD-IA family hydrolase [bacterium]|nr:HAD-IA family hydrolase [bacterium]
MATSTSREWVNVVSGRFAIADCFDLMVSASDFRCRAKPAPDIYLETADRLAVSPQQCLVLEDSSPGVIAAR